MVNVECPNCGTKIKVQKPTRKPNAYNAFVKTAMARADVQKLPPKQRMKAVAILWRRDKAEVAAE